MSIVDERYQNCDHNLPEIDFTVNSRISSCDLSLESKLLLQVKQAK